ncbi:MAG: Mur ligase family protein, partial [Candidatus Wildermuthbacteria bacterium]|nr:Mur ligase family protein [Candidatus Wildermuthbacteria bacterium]
FKKYVAHLPEDGWLVANKDDENVSEIRSIADSSQTMLFSLKQREAEEMQKLMKIPGQHNVSNALAALSVARILKVPDVISMKALAEYKGTWRRFEVIDVKIENKKLKVPALSYPETLGELTKTHYTIAVSGTHGKSTTTSMIGLLLVKAGFDPTIIVGTKLKELGDSNCRVGKGKYLVIEADEHFASFLNYWPTIIVLTTVEADHLDYYKNLENIVEAFKKYVAHLPEDGWLVANKDDENVSEIRSIADSSQTMLFSLKQREAEEMQKLMKIPGQHNVSNALAALSVARILKVPDVISMKALGEYKGSWRRFEIFNLKKPKPYTLVSDYGHHPTEVKVTVEAAKQKWPDKPIWLVFQPHQYQRTYLLWDDFVKVLSNLPVEKLILTDIYDVAGREDSVAKANVSSEKLASAVSAYKGSVLYLKNNEGVETYLKENLKGGEIVMVMGAGDIYNLTLRLTQPLRK